MARRTCYFMEMTSRLRVLLLVGSVALDSVKTTAGKSVEAVPGKMALLVELIVNEKVLPWGTFFVPISV